jgi:hypothetical protein
MNTCTSDLRNRPTLVARLRADQSQRWGQGERVPVESYLKQHPELESDPDALLDLVYAEVLLRMDEGDNPTLDEYLGRFPAHADHLRKRWQVHGIIRGQTPPGHTALTVPYGRERPVPRLPELPGYEVIEELGKGGMGIVYKARQIAFDRLVAIKMIRSAAFAGPEEVARFHTEARAVGRLDHPHVVRVFTFGQEQDGPYFVMEYLSGGSLTQLLEEQPLDMRRAVELVRQVALGVQAAHDAGILHRDLKPANVLLDSEGKARVADFGLAKLLDGDAGQTISAAIMGTPAYMAPEQAAGLVRSVGPATDVWALGVILYECLTGKVPFKGAARTETLELVKKQPPAAPRKLRAEVPAELEAVCLKCLEKRPDERYASAAEVAGDLERFLQGEPTVVRPLTWPRWCWRLARSHRWASQTAITLLLLVGIALLAAPFMRPLTPREKAEATLAAGKPFVFEGGGELPGPFRWVATDPGTLKPSAAEGSFSIQTLSRKLLEVVADPQCDRYLFSAEVRHDGSGGESKVGLYFGYREHLIEGVRPQSAFFTLTFADWEKLNRKGPPQTRALVQANLFEQRNNMDWAPNRAVGQERAFTPHQQGRPAPWRKLAVKVTPEGVDAFWSEGNGPLQRFTTLTPEDMLRALVKLKSHEPGMAALPEEYRPRGGLGLFVFRGQSSFRMIRVEPLPKGADLPRR